MKTAKMLNLFSRDDFFRKALTKSGSVSSESMARSAVRQLDFFCNEMYKETTQNVLTQIKQETREEIDSVTPMVFLDKFADYLTGRVMPSTSNHTPCRPKSTCDWFMGSK
ncbi:MAG: hypothetical protein GKS07_05920 [Nitrosopumilus sp.]|nr:MAG: hypothetical protein GKS07_05920 [Nitrosopumilus sp.]